MKETGFMTEKDMKLKFSELYKGKKVGDAFEHWYEPEETGGKHKLTYGHHDTLLPEGYYNCNLLVDEWFRWFLTTPAPINPVTSPSGWYAERNLYGDRNVFALNKRNTFAYFIAASPFQDPHDVRRVVITRKAPILVPVYNVSVAAEECPSILDLKDQVLDDLKGLRPESVKVSFDDMDKKDTFGCTVVRENPLEIPNVPEENVIGIPKERLQESNFTIHVCHGGFWLLIKEDKLKPGDHLLSFESASKNYEIKAKVVISVLV